MTKSSRMMLCYRLPCFLSVPCSVSLSSLPKRPSNPYISFVSDNYKEEIAQHPPKTPSKLILKCLGSKWNELSAEEKSVYREKFNFEMKKYGEANSYLSPLPKRPNRPYNYFISDNFKEEKIHHPPNVHSKLIMKSLGNKWKQLSSAQKAVYYQKVEADMINYDDFFKSVPLNTIYEVTDNKERKLFLKKLVENGRLPKKPPHSGYTLFVSRQKRDSNLSNIQNMTLFAQRYQKLSESEKSALSKEVELMKEGYNSYMERVLSNT